MVERRHQPDLPRQQHAVAEHVAGHVADAGDRERRGLDVGAELAEVPLDALPGAARRDTHLLVVVAGRAAGGERVAEPESARHRDLVGDVREAGGALVGGDHEVGIVAIVAHGSGGWHDAAVDQVVRDLEQCADERAVCRDPLALRELTRRARGQAARHEATLGAHRDDQRVLDVLRLHQAQHLGAEVLAPVGPADATARHRPHPQVHALDRGRVDEHLEPRAGQWQPRDAGRVELQRQHRRRAARGVSLPVVGAQHREHHGEERAQDPVLVGVGDRFQSTRDRVGDARGARRAATRRCVRVEARLEQPQQVGRERRMAGEHAFHVGLAEGQAGLQQVAPAGAQHDDLSRIQRGRQQQPVEAVVLEFPAPGRDAGGDEARLDRLERQRQAGGVLEFEVLDAGAAGEVRQRDPPRPFGQYPQAEILHHRQQVGDRDRIAGLDDPQRHAGLRRAGGAVQVQSQALGGPRQCLEVAQVLERIGGLDLVLVRRREGVAVARREPRRFRGLEARRQRAAQAVGPGRRRQRDPLLEFGDVRARRRLGRGAHHDVQARVVRARDLHLGLERESVQRLAQDPLDAVPDLGGVAVARHVDHAGPEAVERVAAQQQPRGAPFV